MKYVQDWSWFHLRIHLFCLKHQIDSILPGFLVKFLHGKRLGRISHVFFPAISWCLCCKTSWGLMDHHTTQYIDEDGNAGIFPLCVECFGELTPEKRLPYYRELYEHWRDDPDLTGYNIVDFSVIEKAVMAEASES